MSLLNPLSYDAIACVFAIAILICYPMGRIFISWLLHEQRFLHWSMLAIYVTTGMMLAILIILPISVLIVDKALVLLSVLFAWLIFVYKRKFVDRRELFPRPRADDVFPIFLTAISTVYFAVMVHLIRWPSPGDIMRIHGPLVALIRFNHKLPTTLDPIVAGVPVLYPVGFHVLVATINSVLGLYSPQAVLAVGAVIASFIPLALYSLTYEMTRSKLWSVLSYMTAFIVTGPDLEAWIMGYFFNGPYSNMLGYLIIFALAFLCCASTKNPAINLRFIVALLLFIVSLFTVYPSFAFFPTIYLLVYLIRVRESLVIHFKKWITSRKAVLKIVFGILLVCVLTFLLVEFAKKYIPTSLLSDDPRAFETELEYLPVSFFFSHFSGIIILVAVPVSVFLLCRKRDCRNEVCILYLMVFIPIILAVIFPSIPFFYYVAPRRSVIILAALSWPIIFYAISRIGAYSIKFTHIVIVRVRTILRVLTATVLVLLLCPSIFYFATFEGANYGWLANSPHFDADFEAISWISEHVTPNDRILTDGSLISWYINSLSPHNLTYNQWAVRFYPNAAEELWDVWLYPYDVTRVASLLSMYNVSFIFSSSEEIAANTTKVYYNQSRPHEPQTYAELFDSYPFLRKVFAKGNTRIYSVIKQNLYFTTVSLANVTTFTADVWGEGEIGTPIISYDFPGGRHPPLRIDIPYGNKRFWGVAAIFTEPQDWSQAHGLLVSLKSNHEMDVSIILSDALGTKLRYDYRLYPSLGRDGGIWLSLTNQKVQPDKIVRLDIATGWLGPFPETGDIVWLSDICLVTFYDRSS